MANPQKENGHIDIANEIAENLARYRFSGQEWQVLWVILRKTWGWHKKKDRLSLGYIAKMTLIKRPAIARIIKKLIIKNVIKKDNSYINIYMFNKDYETWKSVIKKDNRCKVLPKKITGVIKNDNKGVIKKDTTTKENTKETIQKKSREHFSFVKEIISYLNEKADKIFKPETKDTQRHINARLKEGYKLSAFKWVIEVKCSQWRDTDMDRFLRPETLFGNKFESYLNEIKKDNKEEKDN